MEFGYKPTNITSVKGAIGERIFIEGCIDAGKLVYGLLNGLSCTHCGNSLYGGGRRHFFDFFVMPSYSCGDERVPFASIQPTEVKTKKSLHGKISINRRDLDIYKQFSKSLYTHSNGAWSELDLMMVFVDDETGIVYQAPLKQLLQPCMIDQEIFPQAVPYTEKQKDFDYDNEYWWFSLDQLKKIFKLSVQQLEALHGSSSTKIS